MESQSVELMGAQWALRMEGEMALWWVLELE
jgi:hypothetical protein